MIKQTNATKDSAEMPMKSKGSINAQSRIARSHMDQREASTSITSSSTQKSMLLYPMFNAPRLYNRIEAKIFMKSPNNKKKQLSNQEEEPKGENKIEGDKKFNLNDFI